MSRKENKSDKNSSRAWESYGVAFWVVMAVVSAVMAVLGLVTFGFAMLRILYGDHWFMWFILAASGAGAFALSVFCFDLFPTWAGVVRTIRLSDARMAGAMSISQINKYEEREDRRTAEVKDKVQESYTKVGKDVLTTQKQVSEMDEKISRMIQSIENYQHATSSPSSFKNIESSIATLNKKLENYITLTEKSIKELDSQLSEIKEYREEKDEIFPSTDDFDFFSEDENEIIPEPPVPEVEEEPEQKEEETEKDTADSEREEKEELEEKSEEPDEAEKKARSVFGGPRKEEEEQTSTDKLEDENTGVENSDSTTKETTADIEYEDEDGDYFQ